MLSFKEKIIEGLLQPELAFARSDGFIRRTGTFVIEKMLSS
jgi:hypothetical protein